MSLSGRMEIMGQSLKDGSKNTAISVVSLTLRFFTGLALGLVLALILQVLMGLGQFSMIFLTILFLGIFLRLSSSWSIPKILIFDLIAALVAVILRMYIYYAP